MNIGDQQHHFRQGATQVIRESLSIDEFQHRYFSDSAMVSSNHVHTQSHTHFMTLHAIFVHAHAHFRHDLACFSACRHFPPCRTCPTRSKCQVMGFRSATSGLFTSPHALCPHPLLLTTCERTSFSHTVAHLPARALFCWIANLPLPPGCSFPDSGSKTSLLKCQKVSEHLPLRRGT